MTVWSVSVGSHWSMVVSQVCSECTVWSASGQSVEQPVTGQWWSVKCSESVQCGQRCGGHHSSTCCTEAMTLERMTD